MCNQKEIITVEKLNISYKFRNFLKRGLRIRVTLEISLIKFVAQLWNTVQISNYHNSAILVLMRNFG